VIDSSGSGNLTIHAGASGAAKASSTALAGGVVSGVGSDASTEYSPIISGSVATNRTVTLPGTLTVEAVSHPLSNASSTGVADAGLASVGISTALADSSAVVTATVGTGSGISSSA